MSKIKMKVVETLTIIGVFDLILIFYFFAYIAWTTLKLPMNLYLNPWLCIFGILTLVIGTFIFIWVQKVFPLRTVLKSTASTLLWFMRRRREVSVRHHLLTIGPYAYMRHPIYLGAWFITLGLGLLFGFPLIALVFMLIWFNLIVHFEEKELLEIYGREYEEYRKKVPKFIPCKTCIQKQKQS